MSDNKTDNTEIVKDFVNESKILIKGLMSTLEEVEGDSTQVKKLSEYGNQVDRIMGGAKSLALLVDEDHALHVIADYAALCKAVGYKTSQIRKNDQFYDICVALLMDATETLNMLLDRTHMKASEIKKSVSSTFLERLKWVSQQFDDSVRASVGGSGNHGGKEMSQSDIDDLMKKLGF